MFGAAVASSEIGLALRLLGSALGLALRLGLESGVGLDDVDAADTEDVSNSVGFGTGIAIICI